MAKVYIDRRVTFGESAEGAIEQVRALVAAELISNGDITVEMMKYAEPSYTGFVFPVDKYFPAWALDESHPLVQAGLEGMRAIGLPPLPASKRNFTTHGIYWLGKARLPSIGFGPGGEGRGPNTPGSGLAFPYTTLRTPQTVLQLLFRLLM